MTEKEFHDLAVEMGYTDDEIKDLFEFQKETGLPVEDIPLIERIYD